MLGQWFCHVVGLGYVLPDEHVKKTMSSIFNYNWRPNLLTHDSVQRVYALNDEAGLLLCTWPKGGRPAFPFWFSDEVWTGFEYQVAAHLIYEGLVKEGLTIIKGARDRHDGVRRNPWNEFECGHHYARAMSSWSLILALSGYQYSAVEKSLSFAPKVNAEDFRCFFSTGTAWGSFAQKLKDTRLEATVEVRHGKLEIKTLGLTIAKAATKVKATIGGKTVEASLDKSGRIVFAKAVKVEEGDVLDVRVSW
jgi:hypothetical protein